jgi:hypothetical protein
MNTIETRVLQIIGENTDSPDVFADTDAGMAQIRESINDSIEEICMVTGSSKREYQLPLEDSKSFYRLRWTEDDLGWITDAWLVTQNRRLEQSDLTRMYNFNPRWLTNTGSPQAYIPLGSDMVAFWPRPAADGDIVAFTCVIIPGRYSDDKHRIKVRNDFQWASVHFSVGEYYASRGDAKSAMYYHSKYLEKLGLFTIYPLAAERRWQKRTDKEPYPKYTD